MPRILVAYHSQGGHTRRAAERLAGMIGADLVEIRPATPRRFAGPIGLLRATWMAGRAKPCPIAPVDAPLSDYDLVVVATPIWARHITPPVRTFLAENRERLSDYATLYTYFGQENDAGEDMARLCGPSPRAVVDLRNAEEGTPAFDEKLATFVRELDLA